MRWSSGWSRVATTWAFNGMVHRTLRTNASVRSTMTARTVAIVAPIGPRFGWVRVYVDGVFQRQVSLYAKTGSSRKIVWYRTFPTDGPKVVELRAVRTTSRNRVEIDAILTLR